MNIKVILLFVTINILLFAQYTSVTNNNILVNTGEGRVDYTTYTIYADATADFITDTRLHPEALLILQQQAEEETVKTLYDTLGNIPIDSDDTIYNIIENNIILKEKVVSSINNARLVGISYPSRTSVKVLMALDMTTNNLMADLVNNINVYKTDPIITYFDTGTDYDSLVIDARNIGFTPSLFPTVYDENGNEIYSIAYINKAIAATNGYITYSTNSFLTNGNITNIVGQNPYNIVAWRASTKLKNAIKNCKVVFIID